MIDIEARKAQLLARRDELVARMRDVDAELDSHQSKDWGEYATEAEQDEVLERLGHAARGELVQIEAALTRIATDDYGYCVRCGDEIASARLDLLPYTPLCAGCAR